MITKKLLASNKGVYLIVSESFIAKDFKLDFFLDDSLYVRWHWMYRYCFIGEINLYLLNLSAFDRNDRYNAGLKFKMMLWRERHFWYRSSCYCSPFKVFGMWRKRRVCMKCQMWLHFSMILLLRNQLHKVMTINKVCSMIKKFMIIVKKYALTTGVATYRIILHLS